jgi:23S rRNA (uridine2552-2'-O)-methyltransferase
MYAAERVGKNGRVVGIDLQDVGAALGDNVVFVRGDVFELGVATPVTENAPYAVVLSDMAPSTSGSKGSDQARSFELFMRALDAAKRLGDAGSAFVGKIFMSGDFPEAKKAVAAVYDTCRVLKPEGTRKTSTEVYVVGTGLKTRAGA